MTPRIKHALTLEQYLTALYRRESKPLFDAVAVHPYSPTPGGVLTAVEEVRALMRPVQGQAQADLADRGGLG